MRSSPLSTRLTLLFAAGALWGCADSHTRADGGVSIDSGADGGALGCVSTCATRPLVDVAVVVQDQTGSGELVDRVLGALARQLVAIAAHADVRVGILSTDVGIGDAEVFGCSASGDGGALQVGTTPGCEAPYVDVEPTLSDQDLEDQLTCRLRGDDCGFEQPLESALWALTPSSSSIDFVGGAGGGDTTNAGFMRPDAALVIVFVSQENDCSAADRGLYDPDSTEYDGSLDLRCYHHPAALRPVERYVEGFLALGAPERTAVFLFGGVPADVEDQSVEEILADDRMREALDPVVANRLTPSCRGLDQMYPPRRQLEVLRGLEAGGATVGLGSACAADLGVEMIRLTRTIDALSCARCAG